MRLSRELSLAFHPSRDELLISRSSRLPTRRSFERTVGKKGRVYAHIYIYISIPTGYDSVDNETFFYRSCTTRRGTKEDRLRDTTCPYRKRGYEKR